MAVHRIQEDIEKRVWLYAADRMANRKWDSMGITFSDALGELLKEVGF